MRSAIEGVVFSGLLLLHSWLRWVLLIVALITLIRTSANHSAKAPWTKLDDRFSLALVGLADLQLAFGLTFWMGLSPTVQVAFAQGIFTQSTLTFFALVHPIAMIAAILWLHVGRVRLKKSPDAPERHGLWRRTTLSFVAILVLAIPWPSLEWARPLFRMP